jgi:hypothetical protein
LQEFIAHRFDGEILSVSCGDNLLYADFMVDLDVNDSDGTRDEEDEDESAALVRRNGSGAFTMKAAALLKKSLWELIQEAEEASSQSSVLRGEEDPREKATAATAAAAAVASKKSATVPDATIDDSKADTDPSASASGVRSMDADMSAGKGGVTFIDLEVSCADKDGEDLRVPHIRVPLAPVKKSPKSGSGSGSGSGGWGSGSTLTSTSTSTVSSFWGRFGSAAKKGDSKDKGGEENKKNKNKMSPIYPGAWAERLQKLKKIEVKETMTKAGKGILEFMKGTNPSTKKP